MNTYGQHGVTISAGERFNYLTIIREVSPKNGHRKVRCLCDCGKIADIYLSALRSGNTKSCGCLRDEKTRVRMKGNKYHLGYRKVAGK